MADSYTLRLLVVDDERAFGEDFRDSLEQEQEITYHVIPAQNGAEAHTAVREAETAFDVLVIDQRLHASREDGIELMKALRQSSPESTAIVVTANTNLEDALRALEAGADDYIHKSGDWPEVFRVLQVKIRFLASGRRTKREMEWLQELNKVGQRFQECVNRQEVAEAILEGALTLGFRQARLWEVFYDDGETRLKGWKQSPPDHLPGFEGRWMEVQRSKYSERTLASRVPVKFEGRELGPSPVDKLYPPGLDPAKEGVWLDVALWNEKRPLAKMSLYHYTHARPLDSVALKVVELYAQQAAAALHRIQLFEQTAISEKLAVINEQPTPRTERELDGLLDFIYQNAREALNAENGFICLVDHETRQMDFRITYKDGKRVKHRQRTYAPHQGLAGYMLTEEKPLRLSRGISEFIKTKGLVRYPPIPQSWLGAPIRYENRVLGVIVVRDMENELAYTDWDQRILEMIADQAASALHNARLSMQAYRAAQQLAMLQYISNEVVRLAPDDLDKMLHVVLTAVTASYGLQLNRAMLFLKHPQRGELVGYLGIGHLRQKDAEGDWAQDAEAEITFTKYLERLENGTLPRTPLEKRVKGLRLRLDDPRNLFTRVFRTGQRLHVLLPKQAAHLPASFRRAVQPRQELWLVPLQTEEQTIGVLAVDNRFNHRPIDDETLERLQTFVNRAAFAIENDQQHRTALDRQVAELRAHNELQKAIIEFGMESDLQGVLASVVKEAKKTLPGVDTITLFYFDPKEGDLRLGGQRGVSAPEKVEEEAVRSTSVVQRALRLNKPRYVKDSAKNKLTTGEYVKRERICSTAVFPLILDDERIGCMFFSYRKPRKFDERERTELEVFSNQASLAIHKALQNDAVRRSQERLKTITEITPIINSTLDPEQVVARVLKATRELVPNADHAAMLYYEAATGALRFSTASSEYYPVEHPKYQGKLWVEAGESSVARDVIEKGETINVDDVRTNPHYLMMIASTKSELCVPIKADKELLGILVLESDEFKAFTKEDELLLTALADQTAVALKRAQEHDQLVRTQDDLAANSAIAWMGLFGSNLAHSVIQYTYSIETKLLLLREELKSPSAQATGYLGDIDQYVNEMKTDVSVARKFSTGPSEDSVPLLLDHKLEQYVRHLCKKHPDIHPEFRLTCEDVKVRIDPNMLEIPIEKLINNAIKAMSGVGNLIITSGREGPFARVTVQDFGKGLNEEFEKQFLFRKPIVRKTLHEGTGFGLLIARKVLTDHGGELKLAETAPNVGTTFAFYLPIA